jgi:hypothetical protein
MLTKKSTYFLLDFVKFSSKRNLSLFFLFILNRIQVLSLIHYTFFFFKLSVSLFIRFFSPSSLQVGAPVQVVSEQSAPSNLLTPNWSCREVSCSSGISHGHADRNNWKTPVVTAVICCYIAI